MRSRLLASGFGIVLAAGLNSPAVSQVVVSGTGATTTAARDQFRTDLGGGTVAGANGSFGGVRREINWDGVPSSFAAPNGLPGNFFNSNSPRGAVFTTGGTGFEVSGSTTDAGAGQPAAPGFGDINPAYSTIFSAFSPQRVFTPLGSNVFDISFFLPGTSTAALTSGFGAIFDDVDLASTTNFQLFGADNSSLGTFFAPVSENGGFSFLGVSYGAPTISRVRLTLGNAALAPGTNETALNDLVVVDDFLYGEPTTGAVPEITTWAMMLVGFGFIGWRMRRRAVHVRVTTD